MNTRRKVLVGALSVFSVVTAVAVPSANAQPSRVPPGSDSAVMAILARYYKATFQGGPQPEYSHWIDEWQFGDGPVSRIEVYMAKPNRLSARMTIGDQVIQSFGYDGTTGWTFTPEMGVTTVKGRDLEAMRATIRNPLGAAPVASDMRFVYGGKVMFEGDFTDLVLWIDAKGDTTDHYYAVSSGFLSATHTRPVAGRRGSSFEFYRDYKLFGGEQIATTKVSLLPGGTKWTTRMVHMSTDPIPDEKFRRPSMPPPR